MPTREALLQATNGQVPPNMEVVPGVDTRTGERPETVYLLVRKAPVVTGRDLRSAKPSLDQNNQPAVSFTLNNEGARKFSQGDGREREPQPGHHPGRAGAVVAAHREPDLGSGADHGRLHAAGGPGPVARASLGRAAGVDDLPAAA